jgi:hypothetical protein
MTWTIYRFWIFKLLLPRHIQGFRFTEIWTTVPHGVRHRIFKQSARGPGSTLFNYWPSSISHSLNIHYSSNTVLWVHPFILHKLESQGSKNHFLRERQLSLADTIHTAFCLCCYTVLNFWKQMMCSHWEFILYVPLGWILFSFRKRKPKLITI